MMFSTWLEKWRAARQTKAIARHKKRIKNKFGFGEDRHRAISFFKDLGGREGALGLLERFMINTEASIRDEEEKQEVFEILVDLGPDVIPAIEEYINRKDAASVPLTWPLKVLATVAEPAEAIAVIIRALERMGTSYTREPERKALLVSQLAEYNDPRVVPALIPFLRDHRDEVQLETLGVLTRKADESAREAMLELLVDEETPVRLRASIAEALQQLGWDVRGYRKKVEEVLPEGMSLDRSGRIKGRSALSPTDEETD